jgi:FkbM family methyltransferase
MLQHLIALGPFELTKRAAKWAIFFGLCRGSLWHYYDLRRRVMLQLLRRNLYEPAELYFLSKCVPRGGTSIDVGANFGVYTTRLAELVGADGHVLAFEPLRGVYEALVATASAYPQVSCFQQGISDHSAGIVEFKIPLLFGKIPEPALATAESSSTPQYAIEQAEVIHLDSLVEQLPRLDFIKIDVEGHELNCLEGARTLLMNHRALVQFEENQPVSRMHLFQKFAEEIDYVVCKLTSKVFLSKVRTADRIDETRNFYLVPLERLEEFTPHRRNRS